MRRGYKVNEADVIAVVFGLCITLAGLASLVIIAIVTIFNEVTK